MKYLLSFIFSVLISFNVFSQFPAFEWANMIGNPPNTTDTKTTLASLPDGSFFLSGEFLDTAQFGEKTLVSAGGTDIFLVKNDPEGTPVWSIRIGAGNDEYIREINTDNEGNVIISGYFYGTTLIGNDEYTSYGNQDLFIAKYNADGDFAWSYRVGGPMADYFSGLVIDENQDIIITGYYYDEILFGDTTLTSVYGSDIFLAKFDTEGDLQWVKAAGGSSSDQVNAATCDPEGNILIAGSYYYDISLDDTTLTTVNPVGVFVAKYLPGGQLSQVFQLDGTYLNTEIYITAANSGDFYISGNFSEQVTFGDKVFNAGEFNQDIYTAKFNSACDLLWARHAFSYGSDQVVGIATDEFNNLYITGHYLDTIHFELLTLNYTLCCGSREIFIVNYSSSGYVLWGEQISGTRANVKAIEMGPQGKLLLSGLFTEEIILGPLSLSHYDGFRNYVTSLETGLYTLIRQNQGNDDLAVFPNPALNSITIAGDRQSQITGYRIFSIDGRQCSNGFVIIGGSIDITALPPGQFVLQLTNMMDKTTGSCLFFKR